MTFQIKGLAALKAFYKKIKYWSLEVRVEENLEADILLIFAKIIVLLITQNMDIFLRTRECDSKSKTHSLICGSPIPSKKDKSLIGFNGFLHFQQYS